MGEKIQRAIYGSPNKPLKIGNLEIQCYVLEDGTRVLSGRGMQRALGLGQGHGALLRGFMSQKALNPFIDNELAMALNIPLRFIRPGRGGKLAMGYEATILPKNCSFKQTVSYELRNVSHEFIDFNVIKTQIEKS